MNLSQAFEQRILVLDGAMGTMIQRYKLTEEDFRGERFKEHPVSLKGNNDLLVLTRPDVIQQIHQEYILAGADIIETNTFNGTSLSQSDYGTQELAYEINVEAAKVACAARDQLNLDRDVWVAGAIGPTSKTLSISPDVNRPGYRSADFDQMAEAYGTQARGLMDGGADLLSVETIFDTLNAKAAIYAILNLFEKTGKELPIIISGTITDASGRTLSGQTVEAFWTSVKHANPVCVGINCALGATEMKPHISTLSQKADCFVHAYPNAGLPNEFGEYDQGPDMMAGLIREFGERGMVNMIGGCCGTTPDHIRRMKEAIGGIPPRQRPSADGVMRLSGLEVFEMRPDSNFTNVGERTNITGSRKFARLIKDKKYEEALSVARHQVEGGAQILDVNMDEGMLDSAEEMKSFLNLVMAEPDIAKLPVMVDSSKFDVITEGLKCVQGKSVVNSISLKEGKEAFCPTSEGTAKIGGSGGCDGI